MIHTIFNDMSLAIMSIVFIATFVITIICIIKDNIKGDFKGINPQLALVDFIAVSGTVAVVFLCRCLYIIITKLCNILVFHKSIMSYIIIASAVLAIAAGIYCIIKVTNMVNSSQDDKDEKYNNTYDSDKNDIVEGSADIDEKSPVIEEVTVTDSENIVEE